MHPDDDEFVDVLVDERFDYDEETGSITFPPDGLHFPQLDGLPLLDKAKPEHFSLYN